MLHAHQALLYMYYVPWVQLPGIGINSVMGKEVEFVVMRVIAVTTI